MVPYRLQRRLTTQGILTFFLAKGTLGVESGVSQSGRPVRPSACNLHGSQAHTPKLTGNVRWSFPLFQDGVSSASSFPPSTWPDTLSRDLQVGNSGDAEDHFLENRQKIVKTLKADGKGIEKTVSQIQWSQKKSRNSHLYSSVSQAGSQMVGSTLQTPLLSPHHTSSLQVTCIPSLITEQGQRAGTASGARMARAPDPGRLLVCRLPAFWLSGFFSSWAICFSPAWRLQPGFHLVSLPTTWEAEYDTWRSVERQEPTRFQSWSSADLLAIRKFGFF